MKAYIIIFFPSTTAIIYVTMEDHWMFLSNINMNCVDQKSATPLQ